MECKITSTQETNRTNRSARGMTLVEMLIGLGVGSLVLAGVMTTSVFTSRNFLSIGNYCQLNSSGRNALDHMAQDIRQANYLSSYTTNTLVFQMTDPTAGTNYTLAYIYNSLSQTLSRALGTQTNVLMTNLIYYHVDLYQRNPQLNNGGDLYPYSSTNPTTMVKALDFTWVCSNNVMGISYNTEDVQSSRIVIRK